MKYDLHVHTDHSDGIYSPEKIVDLARKLKLTGIAITDHDTITGLKIAMDYVKTFDDLIIIPGIELSSIHKGEEVHILGYYIDYNNQELLKISKDIIESRKNRSLKTIKKLNKLGFDLNIKDVKAFAKTNFIGRPHIARTIIKKGYVSTMEEAFEKYLKFGAPAYVDRYKISIEESIELINNAGGLPVLAHPGLINNKEIIGYCVEKGIKGIEAIHSKHTSEDVLVFKAIAKKHDLIVTGGSDFHGDRNNDKIILGQYFVGRETILKLQKQK